MKSILIRDLDMQLYNKLKQLAKTHHRSLQGELHAILERAAQLAPSKTKGDEIDLFTVSTGLQTDWTRADMYDDSAVKNFSQID